MKPVLQMVIISVLAALTLASQVAISFLPNVELVTLLIILYSINLSKSTSLLIVVIFTILEALVWGFGDWVIGYFWIWSLLVLLARSLKPILKDSPDGWAIFAGVWGFLFGFLFAIQWAVLYGITAGYAYWIKGLVFDIVHMTSNYILVLILYRPLTTQFRKIYQKLEMTYGNHNKNGR